MVAKNVYLEWVGLLIMVVGMYYWFGLGIALVVLGICISLEFGVETDD